MAENSDGGTPDAPGLPDRLESALSEYLTGTDEDSGVDMERCKKVAGRVQEFLAEQGRGHGEIDSHSGEKIQPLDPDPEKIELKDIAHGLAHVGRFAGQGEDFHSVARHSVHVSHEVEARGGSMEAQRFALFHDAAEAYLSDVPGPVKKSLPGYKHAEDRLDEAILDALGIEATDESLVKKADKAVGKHELSVQFPKANHEGAEDLNHDPDTVDRSEDDKELFLSRARDLRLQ